MIRGRAGHRPVAHARSSLRSVRTRLGQTAVIGEIGMHEALATACVAMARSPCRFHVDGAALRPSDAPATLHVIRQGAVSYPPLPAVDEP